MAYVYTPQRQPTRRVARVAAPNLPVRVVPPPRLVAARPTTRVVRYRMESTGTHLGEYLGIVPAVAAAAIPSVKQLAQKALNAVIGIVDPGKKRDANRQARAQIWCGLANAGSITAARRVLGGSKAQYTQKERQYYIDCWQKLMQSKPALAQQAITLGGLPVPEPGSDVTPPSISDEDLATLQREVDAYNTAAAPPKQLPASTPSVSSSLGPAIAIAVGGALLRKVF